MKKLRSDSTWRRITRDQRQQLETWLFDDCISYKDAKARVLHEFHLTCSISSLERLYRRGRAEQSFSAFAESLNTAKKLKPTNEKLNALQEASLAMIGQRVLNASMDNGDAREITAFSRLLLMRQLRELQFAKYRLARKKFEFSAMKALKLISPELKELSEQFSESEERRMQKIHRRIFGRNQPFSDWPDFVKAEMTAAEKAEAEGK